LYVIKKKLVCLDIILHLQILYKRLRRWYDLGD